MTKQDSNLSSKLSNKLQQKITFGDFCPGQKLPSQRVLSQEYSLSRETVREAIHDLELKGLVETYHGGGTLCRNLLESHFEMPPEGLGENFEFQVQVMEMRAALEGEAAYYAALRATDEQLEKIGQEYRAMQERSSVNTTLAKAKADLRFHMMIAEASHNLLVISFSQLFYNRFFNAIYGVLDRTLKKFGRYPDGIRAQHAQIYQALLNREATLARKLAAEHIDYTRKQLEDSE
ncbi:FadR/GntR family transcriptional regulator [Neptuniibacter sp.]|uniref:FadR/GntR family transcriptional regulator n=1 Tax=Neptuniibacter sp. TaxID=1962643 RepID=UPI0026267F8B|nr:FadR/GntR family transcriptional regulator [Neptuniibacter sp.]MCP4596945.1 FadR family transcriptional regulator [Neptuniibacter sp.]